MGEEKDWKAKYAETIKKVEEKIKLKRLIKLSYSKMEICNICKHLSRDEIEQYLNELFNSGEITGYELLAESRRKNIERIELEKYIERSLENRLDDEQILEKKEDLDLELYNYIKDQIIKKKSIKGKRDSNEIRTTLGKQSYESNQELEEMSQKVKQIDELAVFSRKKKEAESEYEKELDNGTKIHSTEKRKEYIKKLMELNEKGLISVGESDLELIKNMLLYNVECVNSMLLKFLIINEFRVSGASKTSITISQLMTELKDTRYYKPLYECNMYIKSNGEKSDINRYLDFQDR